MEWVKIKLQNLKSLNLVTNNGKSQPHILLAGDFNCPDINWDSHTVIIIIINRDLKSLPVTI